jgi:hypothetical protein
VIEVSKVFELILYGSADEVLSLSSDELSLIDERDGYSLLHMAVMREDESVVHALLTLGANPNVKDRVGRTPLHYASLQKNECLILKLLNHGALYSIADNFAKKPAEYTWEREIINLFNNFEYDSFEQVFQIRYGREVGMWIEEEIKRMYLEVDNEYYDNLRVAQVGNVEEEAMYNSLRANGCCGFEDREVHCEIDGKSYKFGMNYGH